VRQSCFLKLAVRYDSSIIRIQKSGINGRFVTPYGHGSSIPYIRQKDVAVESLGFTRSMIKDDDNRVLKTFHFRKMNLGKGFKPNILLDSENKHIAR